MSSEHQISISASDVEGLAAFSEPAWPADTPTFTRLLAQL